jgi:hypothetical protein
MCFKRTTNIMARSWETVIVWVMTLNLREKWLKDLDILEARKYAGVSAHGTIPLRYER